MIGKFADANELRGVVDVADFNDDSKLGKGKEMVDRLSDLVAIFEDLLSISLATRPTATTCSATPTSI